MGIDTRRPILPAPTESIIDTTGSSVTGTDLATDISRRTDKTSYSIPDDGRPVTISTHRKHRVRGDESKLSRSAHHSQTSLLIEYFEGGKGSGSIVSRPSVRVRVTPSSGKKSKDPSIHITESSGNKRPAYSRRISLGSPSKHKSVETGADDQSYTSSNSATDENRHSGPVEIELLNRDQASELSSLSRDRRYLPTSDISSMPADSMLEAPSSGPRRKRSQSLEREASEEPQDYLKTPTRQRSRSLSTERIAARAAEKLSNYPREVSSKRNRSEKNRDLQEAADLKSPRRRGHHHYHYHYPQDDDMVSPESSLLSASAVSSHRRSGDQYSFRSNTSKSSLNNPKLLETVEDAIRRLILPELKELKKDQKVISNTSKFERDVNASYSSASSPSPRDGLGRRLSKHASAPDVRKPKIVLNQDSQDEGITLAGDSGSSQKERRASRDSQATTTDAGYVRGLRPELTEQDKIRRQRSKGLRDAEKAAIVGSRLTAANLKHHDSRSSLDKYDEMEERAPKGINETELVFQKHNIAPMPLRSAIESDMTRNSLLSERTLEPETHEEFLRASVGPHTPNRTPLGSRHDLALKHSNMSSHNLSIHSASDNGHRDWSHSPPGEAAAGAVAAAAAANLLDAHLDHPELDSGDHLSPRRALSPIQSVASNQSESHVRLNATQHLPRGYSGDENELEPRLSIDSLSSAPSTSLARSKRPEGISVVSQSEILRNQKEAGPDLGYEESSVLSPQSMRDQHWLDESEGEEDLYPHSMAESLSADAKHLSNYADDSEVDFMATANQGRPVAEGIGANPRFIHPIAIESAVASLLDPSILDPSILDTKSNQSGVNRSQPNLPVVPEAGPTRSLEPLDEMQEEISSTPRQGSPLKQRQDAASPDATSFPRRMGATSPPQSVTQSLEDLTEQTHIFATEHEPEHESESPIPQAGDRSPDSESEINTNPSIIQGPIGGVAHDNHWPYNSSSQKAGQSPLFDQVGAAAAGAGLGLGAVDQSGYNDYYPSNGYNANNYIESQYPRGPAFGTPPGVKDEGYMSAAHPLSPSPEPATKGLGGGVDSNGFGLFDSPTGVDDNKFGPSHQRHFSGYSHGVESPLYDSATGKGIDRIQSQDIVALMDHLTVRDAQRNARDTEILVTLVRSAAEMRNSFEEMKKFIALQDGLLQDANDRHHERTHKALGGPRPLPASGARSTRQASVDDEDLPQKRKNLFKRALKGLSLKSSNDLTRIEEMLEQLLDEVETLRANQDDMLRSSGNRAPPSVDLDGYEPEGLAGTSSPGDHSGYLSTSSRPVAMGPRGPENRVSTVPEAEEEDEQIDERGEFLSPPLLSQESPEHRQERAGSASLSTPPRGAVASGALSNSNETTPKTNEKSRKPKSSTRPSSRRSRAGPRPLRRLWEITFAIASNPDAKNTTDYYDPQADDRIRSTYTLEDGQHQENRPPSPLVPSQVSEAPKYRAHRDSLDLQHPQPRQGPTGRYQSHLESQAQVYGAPTSGSQADQWGSNPSFSALNGNRRYSGGSRLSPISDAGYSETNSRAGRQAGPPRPPKVKDDGPLFPERPSKVKEGDEQSYVERVASRSSVIQSPRNTPPPRKPTGPRPLNSGSQYNNSPNRRRRNYSPDHVDDEPEY
ncbi:hypothetical protein ARAM_005112 [Aspergillus rambellii]|uniref:Uncharacterized protein n=1 Tax=Aspergillus rambellii TaxID=308745 RepID=A0A0F8VS64_9EURO|nr:hypothetical protein ARAM_005112 [Aspergillus rambellii]